jgi:hypothetical protein
MWLLAVHTDESSLAAFRKLNYTTQHEDVSNVRYAGVISFVFAFHILQLDFTQHNLCCISKSTMKRLQKSD